MNKASLESLIGRSIRVDRGGPESRTGKLMAAKNDHFVVYSENDGMIYYKIDHVKSLTLDTRDLPEDVDNPNVEQPYIPKFIDVDDFPSVVDEMQNLWVQINRGGPEKLEGVLVDTGDTFITVVSGNEVIQVQSFHIRNISYGLKKNNDQNKNNQDKEKNAQDKGKGDK